MRYYNVLLKFLFAWFVFNPIPLIAADGNSSGADYYQVIDLNKGAKVISPGDEISVTVTPPGRVTIGKIETFGGWPWSGGTATFKVTIPQVLKGRYSFEFRGKYSIGEGKTDGKELKWEMDVDANIGEPLLKITPHYFTVENTLDLFSKKFTVRSIARHVGLNNPTPDLIFTGPNIVLPGEFEATKLAGKHFGLKPTQKTKTFRLTITAEKNGFAHKDITQLVVNNAPPVATFTHEKKVVELMPGALGRETMIAKVELFDVEEGRLKAPLGIRIDLKVYQKVGKNKFKDVTRLNHFQKSIRDGNPLVLSVIQTKNKISKEYKFKYTFVIPDGIQDQAKNAVRLIGDYSDVSTALLLLPPPFPKIKLEDYSEPKNQKNLLPPLNLTGHPLEKPFAKAIERYHKRLHQHGIPH